MKKPDREPQSTDARNAASAARVIEGTTIEDRVIYIEMRANQLAEMAEDYGVYLRINRVPVPPLAMGRTTYEVEVWPARVMAPMDAAR